MKRKKKLSTIEALNQVLFAEEQLEVAARSYVDMQNSVFQRVRTSNRQVLMRAAVLYAATVRIRLGPRS